MIGKTIRQYHIVERLGRGGMGIVYRAEDTKLHRPVALKFLPGVFSDHPEMKERFIREARSASALDHPNICTIYEIGEDDEGQLFIAMAYYEGESLAELIAHGPMPLGTFIDLARQMATGLERAHAANIVHRDIKPANIIVTPDGTAKIVDFGLAKLVGSGPVTETGTQLGTPNYMSPEQIRGQDCDHRCDVYSLGVCMYQMLTGRMPFEGDTPTSIIYGVLEREPEPLQENRTGLPRRLVEIVEKAMAKDVGRRYGSAGEVAADLAQLDQVMDAPTGPVKTIAAPSNALRFTRLAVALAILSLVLVVVTWLAIRPEQRDPRSRDASKASQRTGPIRTIAVLPFENLSGRDEDGLFVDGITESLINALSGVTTFRKVISRASVMQYRGTNKMLQQIARELGVDGFVTGSVLREGRRVRVTAQLVDAVTGENVWAGRFEHDVRDVIKLQDELTRAIVGGIEGTVSPGTARETSTQREVDPAALQLVFEGRQSIRSWEEAGLRKGIALFQKAIEIDPEYGPAWAGLADGLTSLSLFAHAAPAATHAPARNAAEKAIALDPQSGAAHATLGRLRFHFGWQIAPAEQEYRTALVLNPNRLESLVYYATFLILNGRFGEGLEMTRRAVEMDPLNPRTRSHLHWALFMARRYEDAIREIQQSLQLNPDFDTSYLQLAWNYSHLGRDSEALAAAERVLSSQIAHEKITRSTLASVYARAGNATLARELMAELLDPGAASWTDPVHVALVHTALGETDEAFDWLDRGLTERSPSLTFVAVGPDWDSLRNDDRFPVIMKAVGLAEASRATRAHAGATADPTSGKAATE